MHEHDDDDDDDDDDDNAEEDPAERVAPNHFDCPLYAPPPPRRAASRPVERFDPSMPSNKGDFAKAPPTPSHQQHVGQQQQAKVPKRKRPQEAQVAAATPHVQPAKATKRERKIAETPKKKRAAATAKLNEAHTAAADESEPPPPPPAPVLAAAPGLKEPPAHPNHQRRANNAISSQRLVASKTLLAAKQASPSTSPDASQTHMDDTLETTRPTHPQTGSPQTNGAADKVPSEEATTMALADIMPCARTPNGPILKNTVPKKRKDWREQTPPTNAVARTDELCAPATEEQKNSQQLTDDEGAAALLWVLQDNFLSRRELMSLLKTRRLGCADGAMVTLSNAVDSVARGIPRSCVCKLLVPTEVATAAHRMMAAAEGAALPLPNVPLRVEPLKGERWTGAGAGKREGPVVAISLGDLENTLPTKEDAARLVAAGIVRGNIPDVRAVVRLALKASETALPEIERKVNEKETATKAAVAAAAAALRPRREVDTMRPRAMSRTVPPTTEVQGCEAAAKEQSKMREKLPPPPPDHLLKRRQGEAGDHAATPGFRKITNAPPASCSSLHSPPRTFERIGSFKVALSSAMHDQAPLTSYTQRDGSKRPSQMPQPPPQHLLMRESSDKMPRPPPQHLRHDGRDNTGAPLLQVPGPSSKLLMRSTFNSTSRLAAARNPFQPPPPLPLDRLPPAPSHGQDSTWERTSSERGSARSRWSAMHCPNQGFPPPPAGGPSRVTERYAPAPDLMPPAYRL